MARVLANCAKMNIAPSEAKLLTWWEYQALVWEHRSEDVDAAPDAPDADIVAKRHQRLVDRGLMRTMH
jgi:hypothetical protein